MKNLLIILACILVAMMSCTKSKEVHPEIGDGNEEFLTVGSTTAHVEYTRANMAELRKVVFHYSLSGVQQFAAAEMTKREDCFELTLTNLLSDTLYSYYYELLSMEGEISLTGKKTFHTQTMDTPEPPTPPTPPSDIPEGAINGLFTINENGDQVYFSRGNLQYQASTNTWRFADNQWDYVGEANANISPTYDGWIDLFGWGTSGYNHGAVCYAPWSTSASYSDYYVYGSYTYNLYDQTGQADWGYNPIINGGNIANQWHTLTITEWRYVLITRRTSNGFRYAKANVNNVNGIILLPDDWSSNIFNLSNTNYQFANFNSNVITSMQWIVLEKAGAVFLPASGVRNGILLDQVGSYGSYWSASCANHDALNMSVLDSDVITASYSNRSNGRSVRLVHDANK